MNNNNSPQKIMVRKEIFRDTSYDPFKWKDLMNVAFEPEDEIMVAWSEPYYTENESSDGYYYASVIRLVEETDAEFLKRIEMNKRNKEQMRDMRYKNFLKLKEEFEPDNK